jgi:hypothetical protein
MFFLAGNRRKFIPSWFWFLFVGLPIILALRWFFWWFFSPSYKRTSSVEIDAPRSDAIPMQIKKDDFTILKGIGPKTAQILYLEGIYSFGQLGLLDPEKLDQMLRKHSITTSQAAYWQSQAALAAVKDWEALEKFQQ